MTISRKRLLRDAGAAAAGVVAGTYARGWIASDARTEPMDDWVIPPAPRGWKATPGPHDGVQSYSQCGEDLAVPFALGYLQTGSKLTYLDIGANDPVRLNNTYYFYRKRDRDVLVEPNPALCNRLRRKRPGDTVLEAGIGAGGATRGDYYVMTYDGLNTFSKQEAEHHVRASKGKIAIREVVSLPLLDINDVIAQKFPDAPTFLSIDTEGLDLAILTRIDFNRFWPPVICAETLKPDGRQIRAEIPEFMATVGYVPRAGSLVNTIFIDKKFES